MTPEIDLRLENPARLGSTHRRFGLLAALLSEEEPRVFQFVWIFRSFNFSPAASGRLLNRPVRRKTAYDAASKNLM
jgi:hypothetical protein